ncbi:MAG: hypothetical protein SCM11_08950 [Bacillota bacterium]|nr:hypothetical protein [Bacillota bacterium]
MTLIANDLVCIHCDELHHDFCFAGLLQLAHDQLQAIAALGYAKPTFHLVAALCLRHAAFFFPQDLSALAVCPIVA